MNNAIDEYLRQSKLKPHYLEQEGFHAVNIMELNLDPWEQDALCPRDSK